MSILNNRQEPVKRRKPAHIVKLVLPMNEEGRNGVVSISVGKHSQRYFISRIASDYGTAFVLEKCEDPAGTAYYVCLDGDKHSCDCAGFTRHLHCKHADGLAALVQAGKLHPHTKGA
jgi:hypothetical protein